MRWCRGWGRGGKIWGPIALHRTGALPNQTKLAELTQAFKITRDAKLVEYTYSDFGPD
jgi:hypothetical protein